MGNDGFSSSADVGKFNLDSETINIDDTLPQNATISLSPKERRKNIKLDIAGRLAGALWLTLMLVIGFHFWTISKLSFKLADIPSNPQANSATQVKDAIAATNDMAKTLYAFLTPLAAGITGYFFEVIKEE